MSSLTSDISGAVTTDTGNPGPAGTTLVLRDHHGNEIATTTAAEDGTYTFPTVAPAFYTVQVMIPPDGYQVVGAAELPADAGAGDVPGVDSSYKRS